MRRVALVTFNSAAHNKPSLIRELLDSVLPQLYNETKVRKELIREVRTAPQYPPIGIKQIGFSERFCGGADLEGVLAATENPDGPRQFRSKRAVALLVHN